MAMPSSFPHPGEPWFGEDWAMGSTELGLRLKKLAQLVEVVVAAMKWRSKHLAKRTIVLYKFFKLSLNF